MSAKLFDLVAAGEQERLGHYHTYGAALEYIKSQGGGSGRGRKPEAALDNEEIPF